MPRPWPGQTGSAAPVLSEFDPARAALGQGAGAAAAMLDLLPEQVNRYRVSDHVITYCNAAWASLYGTTPDRAVGTSLDMYLSSDEMDGLRSQLALLGPDLLTLTDTAPRETAGGVERWIEWADRYLPSELEPEVLSIGRDVTSRHLAEIRLTESEARFRDLAEKSSDIVWRLSTEPVIRFDYLSPSVEHILGYTPTALMGDFNLLVRITGGEAGDLIAAAQRTGVLPSRFDLRFRHADGSIVIVETMTTQVRNGVQGVTRDVTELRRLQAATAELAVRDPLTGLGNRRCFDTVLGDELERTRRSGTPLAVAYIDLDDIKRVNDQLGHGAGDLVLREVGRRLRQVVGDVDRVARLGGDEFAIVFEPRLESSKDLLRRIDEALSRPIAVSSELAIDCRASVGTADTRTVGRRPEDLLSAADEAMYAVKRARRSVLHRSD